MNERIRELAKQAGMESADFPYDEFGMPWEQKKFAELIVKECTNIVEDAALHREPASTYVGKVNDETGELV